MKCTKNNYTLKDILYSYFLELNSDYKRYYFDIEYDKKKEDITKQAEIESKFDNFYKDRSKYFNEITHACDLDNNMEAIKIDKNYSFSERDKKFIISVLKEYTGKLDPLRRGEIRNTDAEFRVFLFEGFMEIFSSSNATPDIKESAAENMYNRLEIPVCKMHALRDVSYKKFTDMIDTNMNKFCFGMNTMEKYTWLTAMTMDFQKFISKWGDLFLRMSEIRQCEIDDVAENKSRNITEAEHLHALLQFQYAGAILNRVKNDKIYQDLLKKHCKMLGIPYKDAVIEKSAISLSDKIAKERKVKSKKKPHIYKIEKKFYDVTDKMIKRYKEIELEVYCEETPDFKIPEKDESFPYEELMSYDALLEKAVKDQNESWEDEKNMKACKPIELPNIDFNELRRKMNAMK